jgi:hypothetical protein
MTSSPCVTLFVSCVASAAIWGLTPLLTNLREPWDVDGGFYYLALFIAGAAAALIRPSPLWAHYLGAIIGQLVYELIFIRVGPLVIIGAMLLFYYGLYYLAGAWLGGYARRRIASRSR